MAGTEEEEWWHHLRVEVVPSGGTARRREKNEKTEETCGKSNVNGGENASVLTPAGPRDPRRSGDGALSWDPPPSLSPALCTQGAFSLKPITV